MSYLSADDFKAAQAVSRPNTCIREIAAEVSEVTRIRVSEIYGPSRMPRICRARELVCFIAHTQGYSYPEIGHALGRHHTTIMHAVRNEQARRGEA